MPAAVTAFAIAQSRYLLRPRVKGAAAIRAMPRTPSISADQLSAGGTSWPPKRGPIAKTAVDREMTRNPLASSRSTRRPSVA